MSQLGLFERQRPKAPSPCVLCGSSAVGTFVYSSLFGRVHGPCHEKALPMLRELEPDCAKWPALLLERFGIDIPF